MIKSWSHDNFIIHEFQKLESTNSHAFELANSRQILDHEIILAHQQNMGRDRQNRHWASPVGNLYFSIVLRPKVSAQKIYQLSFVAIAALQLAISKIIANSVQTKWPNDLLIDGKKVAGILLESKIYKNDCEFVILGIGLNIESNPDNVIFPADNLKRFNSDISPKLALEKFLNEFESIYQNWLNFGFAGIRKLWLKNAYRFNEEISVKSEKKILKGIFENFDEEGNLVLKCEEEIIKISTADILNQIYTK